MRKVVLALCLFPTIALADAPYDGAPERMREVQRKKYREISGGKAVQEVQEAIARVTGELVSGAQVATFHYRPNRIYTIYIKPGMFTTFSFPKEETIRQFAISNPEAADVSVNTDANAAMLRLNENVAMSATILTDKRAYFLSIRPATDTWHQGVSWVYDDSGSWGSSFGYRAPAESAREKPVETSQAPEWEGSLSGHPNFGYRMEGDAAIMPVAVWDNGKSTWIQFDKSVQSLPAVFFLGPDGPEVVNYTVMPGGKQIRVNRLMDRFLLKLGSLQVTVTAK